MGRFRDFGLDFIQAAQSREKVVFRDDWRQSFATNFMVPLRGWGCGSLGKGATSILMDQTPKILFPLEQHSCIMLAASIPRLSHAGIRLVLWMCCYWLHKVRPSSWCLHRDAKRDSNKFARTQYDLRSLEGSPSKCQPGARIPARAGQSPPSGSVGGGASHSGLGPSPANPTPKKQKARCRRTET